MHEPQGNSTIDPSTTTSRPPANATVRLAELLNTHTLPLLVGAYVLAAYMPEVGTVIRQRTVFNQPTPMLLLSALMLFAGIGIEPGEIRRAATRWRYVLAGCVLLTIIPTILVALLATLPLNYPPGILAGLGLVALMPSAASSVAWSQVSRGNVAINVALLLLSTLFAPVIVSLFWQHGLAELENIGEPVLMLSIWIVPPIVLGALTRQLLGVERLRSIKSMLKIGSVTVLLLLNYSNASAALPEIVHNIQLTNLVIVIAITMGVCGTVFGVVSVLARRIGVGQSEATALVFGTGMKNTGMALVMAAIWLEQVPLATVAIIAYTGSQHLLAGIYHQWNLRIGTLEPHREVQPDRISS